MTKTDIRAEFLRLGLVGIEEIFDIYEASTGWIVETEQYTFVYDEEREKFVNVTGY